MPKKQRRPPSRRTTHATPLPSFSSPREREEIRTSTRAKHPFNVYVENQNIRIKHAGPTNATPHPFNMNPARSNTRAPKCNVAPLQHVTQSNTSQTRGPTSATQHPFSVYHTGSSTRATQDVLGEGERGETPRGPRRKRERTAPLQRVPLRIKHAGLQNQRGYPLQRVTHRIIFVLYANNLLTARELKTQCCPLRV